LYPFLQKLFADGGYQGPVFQKASAYKRQLAGLYLARITALSGA
jgi:hypothetical protein